MLLKVFYFYHTTGFIRSEVKYTINLIPTLLTVHILVLSKLLINQMKYLIYNKLTMIILVCDSLAA